VARAGPLAEAVTRGAIVVGALVVLLAAPASRAVAQGQPVARADDGKHETVLPELRVDGFVGRAAGVQLGTGVVLDAGFYTRLALLVAGGAERRPGGGVAGTGRAEAVVRFQTDPLRKSNPGVYFGGGLGIRHTASGPTRGVLVGLVGFEGSYRHSHLVPAVELGVGGGARVGVAVRRARIDER
jgi:hypothetical protein